MTDPSKDFRYTIGDKIVEGYQLTEASRYQEKLWPDWLNSRDFLTIDGQQWFVLNGEEVEIPDLAWIVKQPDGRLGFVDAMDFENYAKVVPEHVPSLIPAASEVVIQAPPQVDEEFLIEVRVAFELLQMGQMIETIKALQSSLSSRTDWCNCAPGCCEKLDPWGCREKSPLVKKPRKPRGKPDD